jgi:uncharacterized protein (TIGR00369 family)
MAPRIGRKVGEALGLSVPFLDLLGVRIERFEAGSSRISLEVRKDLTNSWELAHGGVVMTLLDTALATAAMSTEPGAPGLVTVNLSVSFIAAGSGALTAEGRVIRGGRSLVFSEGEVRAADGTVVAKGVGTFKVRPRLRPIDRAR